MKTGVEGTVERSCVVCVLEANVRYYYGKALTSGGMLWRYFVNTLSESWKQGEMRQVNI
jgi:hypothetical protein